MQQTLSIVLPVFGLIALGYGFARAGLLKEHVGDAIGDFVFLVAIPVLVFRTIALADFSAAAPWLIWLPYFAVFGLIWAAGDLMVRRLFGRDARTGVVAGIAAAYGNTVLVGIPLAYAAFGQDGIVPIALIIAVHLPVTMTVGAILIERVERADGAVDAGASMARSVALGLARNPIIISIAAGVLWRLLGLPLGGVPAVLVDRLADVAPTLALFTLGMSLKRYGIRGNIRAGFALSLLKLVLMPALVFLLARYVVPVPPLWAKVMVIAAACPTGVNAYVVSARFRAAEALASNAITISTALAVVSTSLWLVLIESV